MTNKAKKTTKRKYTRRTVASSLFTIEKAELIGGKGNPLQLKIETTMKKMKVSKNEAMFIPATEGSPKVIRNSSLAAYKAIKKNIKDFSVTTRIVKDAGGKFVGIRVWRVN